MKLILSLLKKILVSLSNFYRKDYVNAELDKRVDSAVFTSSLGDETAERKRVDLDISASIDDNEANDEALAKVIEWQGYVDQICRSVDDDVAIAFAEEFEKATEEYLADPMATKEWVTDKFPDGTLTTTNPFYETPSTRPIVDFSLTILKGETTSGVIGSFNRQQNVPVFAPRTTNIEAAFAYTKMNSPVFFCAAERAYYSFSGATSFNQPLFLPKAWYCIGMLRNATVFNSTLDLPNATHCSYMLYEATSFNQPLDLPNATNCSYMLTKASSFNSVLYLPKSTNCSDLLNNAKLFNQPLDLPVATLCPSLVSFTSFNQTITLPEAVNLNYGFRNTPQDNPVYLPSLRSGIGAFLYSAMSAPNIAITLNSLKVWNDGGSHTIGFAGCPGIVHTETTETFTVTDEDGTEYSMENCPTFDTDDENQTLRKAFVLATIKKGWTVEL